MATLSELYPSRFLTAVDLKGREFGAVIESVEIEEFESDGRKRQKPVLYFRGQNKGLVMNKTNAVTVADICRSQDTDAWPGTQIVLYPAMVSFGGRVAEAIRVRAPAAVKPPAGALDDQIPF